jgi:hypothetical protein
MQTQYYIDSPLSIKQFRDMIVQNFTYTIIALENLVVSPKSSITTSRFAAYSADMQISGIIDTTGRGCSGGQGLGKGKNANKFCTATGGAYGGAGGAAASILNPGGSRDFCDEFSSIPYGTFDGFNVFEGSGGGGLNIQKS